MPPSNPNVAERLRDLRNAARKLQADATLIVRADPNLAENVEPRWEALQYLLGFKGSSGILIVAPEQAVLLVDGRYLEQAKRQAKKQPYDVKLVSKTTPATWCAENIPKRGVLLCDPKTLSVRFVEALRTACHDAKISIALAENDILDQIGWSDRPKPSNAPPRRHPDRFSGRKTSQKSQRITQALAKSRADAAVVTDPESNAWLFNIRGDAIPYSTAIPAISILRRNQKHELFINARIPQTLRRHIRENAKIRKRDELNERLRTLADNDVLIDPRACPYDVLKRLEDAGARVKRGDDPCLLPKALKNPTEINGARRRHQRDGAILWKFLADVDRRAELGDVQSLGEADLAQRLDAMRIADGALGPSFPTISAMGANAALPHYATPETENDVTPKSPCVYLVDSGGHYPDATTDVTRVVPIGDVNPDVARLYTLVLKGHIALSAARFPEGTSGAQLDAIARAPLWNAGADYDHGTGHGVGSCLAVHEGPQRIAKGGDHPLRHGMIVSNEPGYYRPEHFGIRIENLLLVRKSRRKDDERPMLAFETLTLVPYERRLIQTEMLSDAEVAHINAYHRRVRRTLKPLMPKTSDDIKRLNDATKPIVKQESSATSARRRPRRPRSNEATTPRQ